MICERCGTQSDNGARVCPRCGAPLRAQPVSGGAAGIRQGRTHTPPPVYGQEYARAPRAERYAQDAGRPEHRRGVNPSEESEASPRVRKHGGTPQGVKRRGVNRALLLTILGGLLFAALITVLVLAIRLPQGHLLLLRATMSDEERQAKVISIIGEENAAAALWQIGNDQLDQGYVNRAIDLYNQAYLLNPEIDGLYEKLLSLADAYEAVGALSQAEAIYRDLYTRVDSANPLAYRYTIAMMLDQGRVFEASDLMLLAYQKTGELSFKSQREQRVPLSPTSSPGSGSYWIQQDVALSSPQDYDVYYLLDDAESELPENGILYTEPIPLGEGVHEIRAVCVSSELISDEVSLRYTIRFPVPSAPRSRLLTGIYEHKKRIYLYMEPEEPGAQKQDIVIYYTIDGTAPNSESPVYTDEGFVLTLGKYTVRAVAVNQYGKVSNEYVGTYTIGGTIKEKYFRDENDQFKGFALGKTTYADFRKTYGAGKEEMVTSEHTYSGKALKVTYDWGTVYFTDLEQVLYSISTSYASMTGPRGTRVGMRLEEVTSKFRDMGQVANAKGNRSIYYDKDVGYGRYYQEEDNRGRLEYAYWREDHATTTLTYQLNEGVVSRIDMLLSGTVIE